MWAEVASAGTAGAKCKAEATLRVCGKPKLSLSWSWCFAKQQLVPAALCLASTPEGQKELAKVGAAAAKEADVDLLKIAQDTAGGVISALPAAVVPVAQCLGERIGWGTLAGLTAKAATGGGAGDLVDAIKPHLVSCGAVGLSGQLGNSPLEQAIKAALSQLAGVPAKGQPGYIDPQLLKMLDDPKVVALLTGGQLKAAATYRGIQLYDVSEVQQQQQAGNSLALVALVLGGALLLK